MSKEPNDKMIIVSEWTSLLYIVANHLKRLEIKYCEIRGDMNLTERSEIQNKFNDEQNEMPLIMLLSLKAGGVGLNIVGASRMFLLDFHWNPALEQQCRDRIHRIGQKKAVTVYKFLCEGTLEEKILSIQETKIELANKVYGISGTGPTDDNPTVNDVSFLFSD